MAAADDGSPAHSYGAWLLHSCLETQIAGLTGVPQLTQLPGQPLGHSAFWYLPKMALGWQDRPQDSVWEGNQAPGTGLWGL